MKGSPYTQLYLHLSPEALTSPLIQKWLTYKDGVVQRYNYAVMPDTEEDKHDYSRLPEPTRKELLTGSLTKRMQFALAFLKKHFPTDPTRKEELEVLLFTDEQRLYEHCLSLGKPKMYHIIKTADAVYLHEFHTILVRPRTTKLLASHDPKEWAAGIRILAHEWFHAMRQPYDSFYPLEEGGAEVFANRVSKTMTGVQDSSLNLVIYTPLRRGILRISNAVMGKGKGVHWVLQSRNQPDQQTWLHSELTKMALKRKDIARILDYEGCTPNEWECIVKKVIE